MESDTGKDDVRVSAKSGQVSCEVDGEAVILSFEDGVYYGLNTVGARIWREIQEPRSVTEILDILTSEYDVSREECLADILSLIEQLEGWGLVSVDGRE